MDYTSSPAEQPTYGIVNYGASQFEVQRTNAGKCRKEAVCDTMADAHQFVTYATLADAYGMAEPQLMVAQ